MAGHWFCHCDIKTCIFEVKVAVSSVVFGQECPAVSLRSPCAPSKYIREEQEGEERFRLQAGRFGIQEAKGFSNTLSALRTGELIN